MKKNREFFYLQYNKINWKNQEKTGINSYINNYIIEHIISKHTDNIFSLFDIGFGVGFFIKTLIKNLNSKYKMMIEGCEPSRVNYDYFAKQKIQGIDLKIYPTGFLETETKLKFDFLTAIYVFPHFLFDELENVVDKINEMLKRKGQFILVLANEKYLKEKLDSEKDLFIESGEVTFNNKQYKEVLHYSDIPEIGKVIDYNREEAFYLSLFNQKGFTLISKEDLDDNGFICTLFVFEKN